jgi:hypothetical protein
MNGNEYPGYVWTQTALLDPTKVSDIERVGETDGCVHYKYTYEYPHGKMTHDVFSPADGPGFPAEVEQAQVERAAPGWVDPLKKAS